MFSSQSGRSNISQAHDSRLIISLGLVILLGSACSGANLGGIAVDASAGDQSQTTSASSPSPSPSVASSSVPSTTASSTPSSTPSSTASVTPSGPPPVVSTISPKTYGVPGGTTLTINGSEFQSGAVVTVGGTSCGSVNFVSASQLTCTLAKHIAGVVDVTVTNPDTQLSTLSSAFTYIAYFYVSNQNNGTVAIFSQNPATGVLTAVGTATVGGSVVYGMGTDPTDSYFYAADYSSSQLLSYSINASTGSLTSLGAPIATGGSPACVVVSNDGKYAYVTNYGGTTITGYTLSAGVPTLMGTYATGSAPNRILQSPAGYIYVDDLGSNDVRVFTVGSAGALTLSSTYTDSLGTLKAPDGMMMDALGKYLYVGNSGAPSTAQFLINSDGSLSLIGSTPTGAPSTTGSGVAVNPLTSFVYVTNEGTSSVTGFDIGSGGGLTAMTPTSIFATSTGSPNDIVVDSTGNYVYTANSGSVTGYTVGTSGALSNATEYTTNVGSAGIVIYTK